MAIKQNNSSDSYISEYINSYNSQIYNQRFFLPPQLLNYSLKNKNMKISSYTEEEIRTMVLSPHLWENQLRHLSYQFYNSISIYKQDVKFKSSVLDFDWEPIPYKKDGKPITIDEYNSAKFKKDYSQVVNFFNMFDVKSEFKKVLFNILLYDTYYTSVREYDGHIYLQELPSEYCIIDAESYLGYLFSFNLSYFSNSGVDIYGYSNSLIKKYSNALELYSDTYNVNLPDRNGNWMYWEPMSPDDSWVFKYNNSFAGSVPPVLDMLLDYSKLDDFKDLEKLKKELEAYKVIFATVPRQSNGRSGNKIDDFAISATELGKYVAAVKETLKVDFKAAPLENFKLFDFSPSASENNLLETEISNMLKQSGLSDAVLVGGNRVSSINLYKSVISAEMSDLYNQFEKFCEHQINKNTKNFKFKIKFKGTIFDREERRKAANEDMERGIITPAIFSSRGIQLSDAQNVIGFMNSLGFPDSFTPIKTASTMSSKEKSQAGRKQISDNELTDSGEQTRSMGTNDNREV